jgi:hypothetical protein
MTDHCAAEIEDSFHLERGPIFNELCHYFSEDELFTEAF